MPFKPTWHGDPIDCQYCKTGKFPHDHAHETRIVRRHSKTTIQRVQAPPRTIQQTLEFGEDAVDSTE